MTPIPLDHGAFGNGRVLALVGPDTSIDWLCLPRFDSPSVFARLLDAERGGSWALEGIDGFDATSAYVRNTNVVRTEVATGTGRFEVFDFAPRVLDGTGVRTPVEIHRLVRPLDGAAQVRMRFDPRPDYARARAETAAVGPGLEIVGGPTKLFLWSNVPPQPILDGSVFRVDRSMYFALSAGSPPSVATLADVELSLAQTILGWRSWVKTCALPSFAPESVLRSALCLKLHAFADTGAIIAAATTSLPEALGSGRTWDYRYCWMRDAAFVVEALRRLSHLSEGEAFVRFLRDVAAAGPLQPVYGIGGERQLDETTLPHLCGYDGVGPVRIGNAAFLQTQHDVAGELVLCLETLLTDPRVVYDEGPDIVPLLERLVGEAMAASRETDTGLWEYRTNPRHYTFSKAMCWVAAHRGARLAAQLGLADRSNQWRVWADAERERVLGRAYSERLGFFTQTLDGQFPDASNLLLPTLGLVEPTDPRFRSTVRAYERRLVDNGLMLRYRHRDDFGETTSAFSICSFWWVEALAMMGEVDEAVALFERLQRLANPLGLFSEDIDPASGRLLGNFPQAYTHVGVIHAAITIGEILDARHGTFRAWT